MPNPATPTASRLPRILLVVLSVLVVVGAVAVIAPQLLDEDDDAGQVFTSTTRSLTYEILGTGTSDQIVYTSGANNEEKTVTDAELPWKMTVDLPIGVAGGTANLIARNPANDTTVACRISMGGKPVNEVMATDGYVDPSCSVPLAAERVR